jgi:Protein of unknown function (DUF1153)
MSEKTYSQPPRAEVVRLNQRPHGFMPQVRLEDLPSPGQHRWVMRRKAIVVAAVRHGLLTLEQACERYTLSVEEFLSWQDLIDRHGVRALRATRVKDYRLKPQPEDRIRT